MPTEPTAPPHSRMTADRWREEAASHDREVRAWFDTLAMAPLLGPHIRSLLESAPVHWVTRRRKVQLHSLVEELAEFIHVRFGLASAPAYKAWRRGAGYELKPRDVLDREAFATGRYRLYVGADPPRESTGESLFDSCWSASAEYANGVSRPVALCGEPAGFEIGLLTIGKKRSAIPAERYHCFVLKPLGSSYCNPTWWHRPGSERGLLTSVFATASIVFEFADGSRRPLHIRHVWNQELSVWDFRGVCTSHVDSPEQTPAIEA